MQEGDDWIPNKNARVRNLQNGEGDEGEGVDEYAAFNAANITDLDDQAALEFAALAKVTRPLSLGGMEALRPYVSPLQIQTQTPKPGAGGEGF